MQAGREVAPKSGGLCLPHCAHGQTARPLRPRACECHDAERRGWVGGASGGAPELAPLGNERGHLTRVARLGFGVSHDVVTVIFTCTDSITVNGMQPYNGYVIAHLGTTEILSETSTRTA